MICEKGYLIVFIWWFWKVLVSGLGLMLGINLDPFLSVLRNYVALLYSSVCGIYFLLLFKSPYNMITMISFEFEMLRFGIVAF